MTGYRIDGGHLAWSIWAPRWTVLLILAACFGMVPVASADDLFPDKNLEAVVRHEVFEKRNNKEPLTVEDVKSISQIVGKGKQIKSLDGLQHCAALMKIDLENNEISDLGPIRDLALLQSIDFASNKISSIEPLSKLVNIQYLQLSKNEVADLAPLQECVNIRSLYLANNKIASLAPVAKMSKLWTLNVAGNPVEDGAPIAQLKSLQSLNLKGTQVKNVEYVRSLTELNFVMLSESRIEDLSGLADACEADAKGERRFAPFLRLYLDSNQLSAHAKTIERLKAAGVRINPESK